MTKHAIAVVTAILLTSCPRYCRAEDAALTDLSVQKGLVYSRNSSTLFSGTLLVRWPDGQKKCSVLFEEGIQIGEVTFWTVNKTTSRIHAPGYVQDLISRQDDAFPHAYVARPVSTSYNLATRVAFIGITFEVAEGYAKGMRFATSAPLTTSRESRFNALVEDASPLFIAMKTDLFAMQVYSPRDVQGVRLEDLDANLWSEERPERQR